MFESAKSLSLLSFISSAAAATCKGGEALWALALAIVSVSAMSVVVSIDEKIRTGPALSPTHPLQQAHGYKRNGTTTLFWLAENPGVIMHFTAASCSWLNMVEICFGIISRQCLKRGEFGSVNELEETMDRYIQNYNQDAKPFTRTKSAEYLLRLSDGRSISADRAPAVSCEIAEGCHWRLERLPAGRPASSG